MYTYIYIHIIYNIPPQNTIILMMGTPNKVHHKAVAMLKLTCSGCNSTGQFSVLMPINVGGRRLWNRFRIYFFLYVFIGPRG